MSDVKALNPGADVIGTKHALMMNINAGKSLQEIVKTNLGPKGTIKMLVGGAGQIKLTKDGFILLTEMQLAHPTAAIIARTATAQDDITGDGTTSNVLLTGELLRQSERYIQENTHPRILVEGIEKARELTLEFLENFKTEVKDVDRDLQLNVARTTLRTKVTTEIADHLAPICVDAVNTIRRPDQPIDLHMVEVMHMRHKTAMDTQFIPGLVLDHGSRHPDMPRRMENVFILTLNVSLEYEKSEVNSSFTYKNIEEKKQLAVAERKFTDDKVMQIIEFKNRVCEEAKRKDGLDYNFLVINQKGVDPVSLDLFYRAGINAVRRAKRRNMERLTRACGGWPVNALEELNPDCLGFAKLVYEHQLGEEKYTFIEGCKNPTSCTINIKGPNDHTIAQVKDAVRDGLRAVLNTIEDGAVVPGAGAFELAAHVYLKSQMSQVAGKAKLGMQAFADALLVIPKVLAQNSGLDAQEVLITLVDEATKGNVVGLDVDTGKLILPLKVGIVDNVRVKKQFCHLGSMIAVKLLLVDEVIRAGRQMGGKD